MPVVHPGCLLEGGKDEAATAIILSSWPKEPHVFVPSRGTLRMKKLWLRLAEGLVSTIKDEVKYLGGSLRFNSNITARLAMTYHGAGDCDKARLLLWVMGWEAWTPRWAGEAVWGETTENTDIQVNIIGWVWSEETLRDSQSCLLLTPVQMPALVGFTSCSLKVFWCDGHSEGRSRPCPHHQPGRAKAPPHHHPVTKLCPVTW